MTAAVLEAPAPAAGATKAAAPAASPSGKAPPAPAVVNGPIVCACDFSPATAGALAAASALARRSGCDLLAVYVAPTGMPAGISFGRPPEMALPAPGLRAEIRAGEPADEILALADAVSASAIVVGAHGRPGAGPFALGPVAEAVARRAACPVLVVPPARGRVSYRH